MIKWNIRDGAIDPNSYTPVEDYLTSLGIDKEFVKDFLDEPRLLTRENPHHLENLDSGLELMEEILESGKPLTLVVDCDVDGFTSSAMFYNFFKPLCKGEIRWRLHEGKEHGVEEFMVEDDVKYIIIPDAGSNQKGEFAKFAEKGIKILVLDHHEVEEKLDIPGVVIINNQISPLFANKSLSGAGVVLKFIEAFKEKRNIPFSYDQYDLAATGIVSDMMDCRTLDNNFIVWHGLHRIRNKMLMALLQKQSYKIANCNCPTKIDIGFYVAPIINGTIRFGEQEEKELLFRGFIEEPTMPTIVSKSRGEQRVESFYDYVARICANAKGRQDDEKKKCADFLKRKIAEQKLNSNQIICITTSENDEIQIPHTITGLVAMELLNAYGKPSLVLHPKRNEKGELVYAGSGRSKPFDGLDSFREFVKDSTGSEYAQGHACAFGAAIRADEMDDFLAEVNDKLKNIEFTTVAEVECEFTDNNINTELLYAFAKHPELYGNNIPQPRFAFCGKVSTQKLKVMKDIHLRVSLNGIDCVRFKDQALCDNLPHSLFCNYRIIGKVQMNSFMGVEKPQILIDEIELTPVRVESLF